MNTSTEAFKLHPQLAQDCILVGQFELSLLLLMNDSNFPWFILVPAITDIREIHHLSQTQQYRLCDESAMLATFMENHFKPDKLNIAALGNMVPQLHIHHIARYKSDSCWPAPIWGKTQATPYADTELETLCHSAQQQLKLRSVS
jgi:diadenosine tetraphosphate (Ap4A) HIT family hydrolase